MNLEIIKQLCEQRKIKIKDLCNNIGISDAGLYKAINNNKISSEYIEKMANFFKCPVSIFFDKDANLDNNPINDILKRCLKPFLDWFSASIYHLEKGEYNGYTREEFIKYYIDYDIYNQDITGEFEDTECPQNINDREIYAYAKYLIEYDWKFSEQDIANLVKAKIISKEDAILLKLWIIDSNYKIDIFLIKYEQYKIMLSMEKFYRDIQ